MNSNIFNGEKKGWCKELYTHIWINKKGNYIAQTEVCSSIEEALEILGVFAETVGDDLFYYGTYHHKGGSIKVITLR